MDKERGHGERLFMAHMLVMGKDVFDRRERCMFVFYDAILLWRAQS